MSSVGEGDAELVGWVLVDRWNSIEQHEIHKFI